MPGLSHIRSVTGAVSGAGGLVAFAGLVTYQLLKSRRPICLLAEMAMGSSDKTMRILAAIESNL